MNNNSICQTFLGEINVIPEYTMNCIDLFHDNRSIGKDTLNQTELCKYIKIEHWPKVSGLDFSPQSFSSLSCYHLTLDKALHLSGPSFSHL